jgi:hypothetical protein
VVYLWLKVNGIIQNLLSLKIWLHNRTRSLHDHLSVTCDLTANIMHLKVFYVSENLVCQTNLCGACNRRKDLRAYCVFSSIRPKTRTQGSILTCWLIRSFPILHMILWSEYICFVCGLSLFSGFNSECVVLAHGLTGALYLNLQKIQILKL